MIKHNLILFFRRHLKNRTVFAITISGMVLALTALILAFTFVSDEKNFDRFHTDGENIFRVNKWDTEPSGDRSKLAETPGLMAGALVNDLPEITTATRVVPWFDPVLVSQDNKILTIQKWVFADSNFLSFFNFKLLQGNAATALQGPGKILVTPALAKSLFGSTDVVGKVITGLNDKLYTITGILEAAPRQSHIQYDAVVSYATTSGGEKFLDFNFMNNWLGQTVYTYVRLNDPQQAAAVNSKLPAFTAKYMSNRSDVYDFYLQPLNEIYLDSFDIKALRGGKYGSSAFLRTFTIISFLILLIACFNYINIITAQSLQRAKEVGVKKVLGADKKQLMFQFLLETFFLMLCAAILALCFACLLLPQLNSWFIKDIPAANLFSPFILSLLAATVLITALISGLLPAVLLSRFKPVSILRKTISFSPGGELSRRVLITIQLCISIGLIAGTLVLNNQFKYMLSKDLGFDKDQVLNLKTPPGIIDNSFAFQQEVQSIPGVKTMSLSRAAMPEGTYTSTVIPVGNNEDEVVVREFGVDSNYLRTYGLTLLQGRFLGRAEDSEPGTIIINEAFAKQMQWKDPLQQRIRFTGDSIMYPVVGVIKDFNFSTLHETVMPVVMYLTTRKNNISIRFEPSQISGILPKLEQAWKKFEPKYPFEYQFTDEFFASRYGQEKQLVNIISLFAAIAIFIACLGLYGLASFSIARRTKEIGIRKILGASMGEIVLLLSKNLLSPLFIAFIAATPLIWYLSRQWLQNFAYQIDLGWWLWIVPGTAMLAIVFITISFQSINAAIANPVKSLRTE